MESKFVESEVSCYFEEFIINKLYKIRQVRTRNNITECLGNENVFVVYTSELLKYNIKLYIYES
jgi:hypothetical protein